MKTLRRPMHIDAASPRSNEMNRTCREPCSLSWSRVRRRGKGSRYSTRAQSRQSATIGVAFCLTRTRHSALMEHSPGPCRNFLGFAHAMQHARGQGAANLLNMHPTLLSLSRSRPAQPRVAAPTPVVPQKPPMEAPPGRTPTPAQEPPRKPDPSPPEVPPQPGPKAPVEDPHDPKPAQVEA